MAAGFSLEPVSSSPGCSRQQGSKSTLQLLLRLGSPAEGHTRTQKGYALPALLTAFVPRRAFQHELCARSGHQPAPWDLSFCFCPIYNGGNEGVSWHISAPCHRTRTKPLSHFLKTHRLHTGPSRKRCQGTLAVTLCHMVSQTGNLIQTCNLNAPSYLVLLRDTIA